MPLAPPITDIEQLKSHPALGRLVEWNAAAVQAAKFDREELTIWIEKEAIREAVRHFARLRRLPIQLFLRPHLRRLVSLGAAV